MWLCFSLTEAPVERGEVNGPVKGQTSPSEITVIVLTLKFSCFFTIAAVDHLNATYRIVAASSTSYFKHLRPKQTFH